MRFTCRDKVVARKVIKSEPLAQAIFSAYLGAKPLSKVSLSNPAGLIQPGRRAKLCAWCPLVTRAGVAHHRSWLMEFCHR